MTSNKKIKTSRSKNKNEEETEEHRKLIYALKNADTRAELLIKKIFVNNFRWLDKKYNLVIGLPSRTYMRNININ